MLIFGLCTAVLTFGQCMHKISTASVDGIVVICIISTDIMIFGVSNKHYLRPVDKCFIQYMCMFCEITNKNATFEGLIGNYAVLSRI